MAMTSPKTSSFNRFGLVIWAVAALFFLLEFFLRTFLGTVVHEISRSLQVNPEELSVIDSAYYITYGIMQIPVGLMVDRFGVRKPLTLAAFICAGGVFMFSFAQTIQMAVAGRLAMGFGSSFAFVSLLALSLNWFPRKFAGLFFGLAQFLGALGPMLAGAPLAMVLYRVHDNWRLVLGGIGVFGVGVAFLIMLIVRDKPPNIPGRTLILGRPEKMFSKISRLFSKRQAWWLVLYSASTYVPLAFLGTLWGTTYLETRNFSHINAAFIASMLWLGLAVGSPVMGIFSDFLKRRKTVMLICSLLGLAMMLSINYSPYSSELLFIIFFLLLGVAGAGQSLGFVTISERVDSNLEATALGFNNASLSFADAAFVPLITLMIARSVRSLKAGGDLVYQSGDFTGGLLVLAAIFVSGLLIAFFLIKETYCRRQGEPFVVELEDG